MLKYYLLKESGFMNIIKSDLSTPIFKQIIDQMKKKINDGTWPEGYKLPSEETFSKELNISRGTVRKAIKELVKSGYLEQVHGKGTFVLKKFLTSNLAQEFISTAESLKNSGIDYETEVIIQEVIRADNHILSRLECEKHTPILYLKRIRLVDDEKIALIENWVNMEICTNIDQENFEEYTVFEMMEKTSQKTIEFGIRSFEARSIDAEQAKLLSMAPESPILYLEQSTYLDEKRVAEYSNIWLKSDKHKIISVLER